MNLRHLLTLTLIIPLMLSAQHWTDLLRDRNKNFYEIQEVYYNSIEGKDLDEIYGHKQFKRWEAYWETRVSESGEFPAVDHVWNESKKISKEFGSSSQAKSNANWTAIGPYEQNPVGTGPGMGRTDDVVEDPNNSNILYVGTAAGGLWKSTNGGSSWVPKTDDLPSLGISGIVIDPTDTDIIYIATGDGNGSFAGSANPYSVGVLKSTDGGDTWQETGLSWSLQYTRAAHKLVMDPADNNTLLVATDEGIWKTDDAGDNWIQVQGGNIDDIEYHPTDPTIIYATGPTVYRSTDSGDSFSSLTNGLPSASDVARYNVAVSPDEPDWVYILAGDDDTNGFLGLWRSTDAGESFSLRANSPNIMSGNADGSGSGGQAWYDIALEVDPDNANRVFVGGINIWRSNNAGSSWSLMTHQSWPSFTGAYTHADIHELKYIGDRLYALTDGGIYRSTNDGSNFTDLSDGLMITQYYRIGPSASDPGLILAGAQDNGTSRLDNGVWDKIYGGDGMNCVVHPTNPDRFFVSYQYGEIRRTINGGATFSNWVEGIPEAGGWVTPFMLDPNDSNTLFAGFSSLWKRTGTGSWNAISPASGTISQFEIAPSDSDVIYVIRGTSVVKTDDGGDTWTSVNPGPGSASKTSVAINPDNEDEVYVTIGGFNNGLKVFKTLDGGDTWENISLNLPNLPANSIVFEQGSNGGVYLGMDVGVYYINNDLVNWIPFFEGLPKVIVSELEIHYGTDKLRAATFGRGVWETDLFTGLNSPPIADFLPSKEVVCVGEEVSFTDNSLNNSPGWNWVFEGATPSTSEEQSPVVTYMSEGLYDVSLTVANDIGDDTETKTSLIQVLSDVGEELPFFEAFETLPSIEGSDRWFIDNEDGDLTWELNSTVGAASSSCVWINNYVNLEDRKDRLISGTIDLGDVEEVELSMDVAFAQKIEDNKDRLRVYVSTDCGEDWSLKKTFSGHTTLKSVEPMTDPFFPASEDDWHTLVVDNFTESNLVSGFRFHLYFENDGGNNLFIDNINLSFISTGLLDPDLLNLDLQLFPNPTTDISNLDFYLLGDREVSYSVYDITGRVVMGENLGELPFGEQRIQLDRDRMSSGVYTVELLIDGKSAQVQWMID